MSSQPFKYKIKPYLGRLRFYAWFAYPVLVIFGIALAGRHVALHYSAGDERFIERVESRVLSDPNSPKARSALISAFFESSGSIGHWEAHLSSGAFTAEGWISHENKYRVFEAVRTDEFVEATFLSERAVYKGEFTEGAIRPDLECADPNGDPMAYALLILLDSYSDEHFCRQMFEALETGTLESLHWRGKPAIGVSFFCDREKMEVALRFAYPEMLLRERVDTYKSGLKVSKTYNDYKGVGGLRLSNSITLRLDDDDIYRISLSSLNFNESSLEFANSRP